MKQVAKFVVLGVLALAMTQAGAQAAVKVSMAGAGDMSFVDYTLDPPGIRFEGKLGYGGGLLFEVPLGQRVGFELGGLFLRRKMEATLAGATREAHMNFYYLPADFRYHLSSVFSLSAGAYYDIPVDDDLRKDYGVQGGLRLQSKGMTKFFVDARYSYGWKTFAADEREQHALLLVGATFGGKK
ncbi:MAG: PorT family protein [Oligoflexia bacterium]|nr:PorT family protein [Oligoflexia bacterium]